MGRGSDGASLAAKRGSLPLCLQDLARGWAGARGPCLPRGPVPRPREKRDLPACLPGEAQRSSESRWRGGGGGGGVLAGTCGGSGWRGRSPRRRADPRSLGRTFEWSNEGPASMPPSRPTTRGCSRPSLLAHPAGTAEAGGLRVKPSRAARGQETPCEDSQTQTQTHKRRNPVVTDQSQTRTERDTKERGTRHRPERGGRGWGRGVTVPPPPAAKAAEGLASFPQTRRNGGKT